MKKSKSLIALMALFSAFGISEATRSSTYAGIEAVQPESQYIVRFDNNGDIRALRTAVSTILNREVEVLDTIDSDYITCELVNITTAEAKALNDSGLGLIATPNVIYSEPTAEESGDVITDPSELAHGNYTQKTIDVDYSKATNAGAGIKIGILDTGLFYDQISNSANDTSYKAFRPLTDSQLTDASYTKEEVANKVSAAGESFIGKDYNYVNSKIIYTYDYAGTGLYEDGRDRDPNVQPMEGNEHGTHVASLAAGNGADYKGVAPNAQLAIMKVFGDFGGGATDFNITAALSDAGELGLDIVNLSLGSPLQDYPDYNSLSTPVYALVDKLQSEGTIVNFSAGNDGRRQTSAVYGDYMSTDMVEAGVLGSYATLDPSNVIASSTLIMGRVNHLYMLNRKDDNGQIIEDQTELSSFDQVQNIPLTNIFPEESTQIAYQVVGNTVGNHGTADEYTQEADVKGKIAVVWRGGGVSFEVMARQAEAHGAIGLFVINNVDEQLSFSFGSFSPSIPVSLIPLRNSDYFNESNLTGTITYPTLLENNYKKNIYDGTAYTVSDFSSQGATNDMRMKPDITAPGSNILGAVRGGYEEMSGTSMASPNITGAMAVMMGEHAGSASELAQYKRELLARAQSTSTILHDSSAAAGADDLMVTNLQGQELDKDGNVATDDTDKDDMWEAPDPNYASPSLQGAGEIDVQEALDSDIWLSVDHESHVGTDEELEAVAERESGLDEPSGMQNHRYVNKIEFGIQDLSKGIDFPAIQMHNESNQDVSYDTYIYIGLPEARIPLDSSTYANMTEEFQGYYGLNYTTTEMRSEDTYLAGFVKANTVTAKANSTTSVDVDGEGFDLDTVAPEVKNYIERYYDYGTNIQGFIVMVPTGTDVSEDDAKYGNIPGQLSVPYLGFYGDYGASQAAEPFDFERESGRLYNSDINNVMAHSYVTYTNPNADLGSHIFGVSGQTESSMMVNFVNYWTQGVSFGGTNLGYQKDVGAYRDGVVAGVEGMSDQLAIQVSMQRDATAGDIYLKDSEGNTVQTTRLWCYPGSGSDTTEVLDDMFTSYLTKSIFTTSYMTSYIFSPMSGALVDLTYADGTPLAEGKYTLEIDYTLAAVDENGEHYKQVQTVPITIARDEPEFLGLIPDEYGDNIFYTSSDVEYIEFATDQVINMRVDEYENGYGVYLFDNLIQNGFLHATIHNHNGLTLSVVIDMRSDANLALIGQEAGAAAGLYLDKTTEGSKVSYEFTVYNAAGSQKLMNSDFTLSLNVGKGLNISSVFCNRFNREMTLDASDWNYDAETGILTMNLSRGTVGFGFILQ